VVLVRYPTKKKGKESNHPSLFFLVGVVCGALKCLLDCFIEAAVLAEETLETLDCTWTLVQMLSELIVELGDKDSSEIFA
jgi:hypothetical protein